jgi:hypothetical protein
MGLGHMANTGANLKFISETNRTSGSNPDTNCAVALKNCVEDLHCDGVQEGPKYCKLFTIQNQKAALPACAWAFQSDSLSVTGFTFVSFAPCSTDQSCAQFQCPLNYTLNANTTAQNYYPKSGDDNFCLGPCNNVQANKLAYEQDLRACCNVNQACEGNFNCTAVGKVDIPKATCIGLCDGQSKPMSDEDRCCGEECCSFICNIANPVSGYKADCKTLPCDGLCGQPGDAKDKSLCCS